MGKAGCRFQNNFHSLSKFPFSKVETELNVSKKSQLKAFARAGGRYRVFSIS